MKTAHASLLIACLALSTGLFISASSPEANLARTEPFAPVTIQWVDSALGSLSLEQKIQMLFLDPNEEAKSVNGLPEFSIANYSDFKEMDGVLPESQLGSIRDTNILKEYFEALADVSLDSGINFIVGPSLNLTYNDFNSETAEHSFGDDPEFAALAAQLFTEAFEARGILVAFKQFPGMGNTERVYEEAPPLIFSNSETLKKRDLVPFKAAINHGAKAMIIGHALVPGVDSTMGQLASNSSAVMRNLLQREMGFEGLVMAELYDPKGKKEVLNPVQYIQNGGELLITKGNHDRLVQELKLAVDVELLNEELINNACRSVLRAKRWAAKYQKSYDSALDPELNFRGKSRRATAGSMVLLRNEGAVIPFQRLDTLKIAYVKIGALAPSNADVQRYARADVYHIDPKTLEANFQALSPQLPYYNFVIVAVDPEANLPRRRFGLSGHVQSAVDRIANRTKIGLVWHGNPKALQFMSSYPEQPVILLANTPSEQSDDLAIQALFGGRAITGTLRSGVRDFFERQAGIETNKNRLAYGPAEEIGIDSRSLKKVDEIAENGIKEKAYPGCQVWLAKDGLVVVNKAFGKHRYDKGPEVKTTDLYDIASITKIAASTASLMHLTDEGLFNLDSSLSYFLPGVLDTTAFASLHFREILSHQAGLPAWIPFYSRTLSKGVPRYDIYSLGQSDVYPFRVANNFFIRKDYPDVLFKQIIYSELGEKKYKYSDVGYYFALRVIERLSNTSMENYVDSVFYSPLGLSTMTYRPLQKFDKSRIVPTEYDRGFRNQLIHGDVHDPGAAMLGGVGGHAGIFSNANDLGIMMQMFSQGGEYGGARYINEETLADFTKCQYCENENRRAAGFDKPFRDGNEGPTCGCTDLEAFGHQGFTGTTTWADPVNGVVYVFLSNRVYPSANNKKLLELDIRTDIQKVFYDAIRSSSDLANKNP